MKGVRDSDMDEIASMYSDIKGFAIQNRDALRNPMRNPESLSMFKAYNDMKGKLAQSVAQSIETKELLKQVGSKIYEDDYDDEQRALFANLSNLPSSAIKEFYATSGRNFLQDFAKPNPFKTADFYNNFFSKNKPYIYEEVSKDGITKLKPKVEDGLQRFLIDLQGDRRARKYYDAKFQSMTPEQLKSYSFPNGKVPSSGDELATAEFLSQFNEVVTKDESQAYKQAQSDRNFRQWAQRESLSLQRQRMNRGGSGGDKDKPASYAEILSNIIALDYDKPDIIQSALDQASAVLDPANVMEMHYNQVGYLGNKDKKVIDNAKASFGNRNYKIFPQSTKLEDGKKYSSISIYVPVTSNMSGNVVGFDKYVVPLSNDASINKDRIQTLFKASKTPRTVNE
jgi:sRNA-binding regulator protein Hfq